MLSEHREHSTQHAEESYMRKIILLLSLALFAMPALAATAQQEKMKTCNAKAKGLKGDEFKKVRDECLKAQPATAAAGTETKPLTPQQEKMKTCNAKAKGLKGDEFKKVRDDCLKAK
jgi:DNA-binding transcriptional regulator YiaG